MALQILEENRKPTFLEQLGTGVEGFLNEYRQAQERANMQRANLAYSDLLAGKELTDEARSLIPMDAQAKADQLRAQQLKGPSVQELKFQEELLEKENAHKSSQKAFDKLVGLVNKGNIGRGSGITRLFGGETDKDASEFETTLGQIESILTEMVSKGKLTDTRFRYIVETLLPKSNQSVNAIRGKLKALADMLDLDPSALGVESSEEIIDISDKGVKDWSNISWTKYYG